MEEVNAAAEKYLSLMLAQGYAVVDVECHVDPNMPAYLSSDDTEFKERMDLEFRAEQRLDASDIVDEVVLKHGHRYLYGEINGTMKWTHEVKLAQRFKLADAERMLQMFEDGITFVPAPEVKNQY